VGEYGPFPELKKNIYFMIFSIFKIKKMHGYRPFALLPALKIGSFHRIYFFDILEFLSYKLSFNYELLHVLFI